MSEIQIILPLSVLEGAESLNPRDVSEFLSDSVGMRERLEALTGDYNQLVEVLNSAGSNLELILNEVSGYDQAKALRKLVAELKTLRRLAK